MKKLPVYGTSKIPVRYKRNAIIGESTELRKFPPILTLRLNLLLTNTKAPEIFRKHRVLEAYFNKTICPTLDEQIDKGILTYFRNGVT